MDDIDRASELEEKHRQQALLLRKPELFPCGFCHNCGESVKPGFLFCQPLDTTDRGCMGDWEERQAARKREGG